MKFRTVGGAALRISVPDAGIESGESFEAVAKYYASKAKLGEKVVSYGPGGPTRARPGCTNCAWVRRRRRLLFQLKLLTSRHCWSQFASRLPVAVRVCASRGEEAAAAASARPRRVNRSDHAGHTGKLDVGISYMSSVRLSMAGLDWAAPLLARWDDFLALTKAPGFGAQSFSLGPESLSNTGSRPARGAWHRSVLVS